MHHLGVYCLVASSMLLGVKAPPKPLLDVIKANIKVLDVPAPPKDCKRFRAIRSERELTAPKNVLLWEAKLEGTDKVNTVFKVFEPKAGNYPLYTGKAFYKIVDSGKDTQKLELDTSKPVELFSEFTNIKSTKFPEFTKDIGVQIRELLLDPNYKRGEITASRNPDDLPESIYSVNNRFHWIKKIKAGREATVILARDTTVKEGGVNEFCAIKIMKVPTGTTSMLREERDALQSVPQVSPFFPTLIYPDPKNDNEVRLHQYSKYKGDNYDFFAMSLVGPDLMTLLVRGAERKKPYMNKNQVLQLFLQVEKAMRLLHSLGISHNDLHSGNYAINPTHLDSVTLIDFNRATRFNKADVKISFEDDRGPKQDYNKMLMTVMGLFPLFFVDDPQIKERFGEARALELLKQLYPDQPQPAAGSLKPVKAMQVVMYFESEMLKKGIKDKTFAGLKEFQEAYADKLVKLFTEGVDDLKPWFGRPVLGTTAHLTSWMKDEPVKSVSDDEYDVFFKAAM